MVGKASPGQLVTILREYELWLVPGWDTTENVCWEVAHDGVFLVLSVDEFDWGGNYGVLKMTREVALLDPVGMRVGWIKESDTKPL